MLHAPTTPITLPYPAHGIAALPALLTTREVALALRVHPESVERWRRVGGGPRFRRLTGGAIRYAASDVAEYLEQAARVSTADPGPI